MGTHRRGTTGDTNVRRLTAVAGLVLPLAGALVLSGCSPSGKPSDDLQVVTDPVAAQAAVSPALTVKPAGQVLATTAVSALAVNAGSLVVALTQPPSLLVYDLDKLGAPRATVPLSAAATGLTVSNGQALATIRSKGVIERVTLGDAHAQTWPVGGYPGTARTVGSQMLVPMGDHQAVDVWENDTRVKSITGQLYSADDVLDTGSGLVVLDRLRTAVFAVDLAGGKIGEGLRAGDGAANAVTDSFGRVLVTDARAGALIAFSADPLIMRQRYPVPGGAYGIAYDHTRNLAWVTLTGRNEVVGFDVRGGEPVEKYRFPTVRQPDSVAVDDQSGRVIVGSAAGEGTQVILP